MQARIFNSIAAWTQPLRALLLKESPQSVLLAPLVFALGAALYFQLSFEPAAWWPPLVLAVLICVLIVLRKQKKAGTAFFAAFLIAVLGFSAAQWRTAKVNAPALSASLSIRPVSGIIRDISPTEKGTKLTLEQLTIEGLSAQETPRYINLTLRVKAAELHVGMRITLKAGLFPPPLPAIPGGFDYSRYFYFEQIGAVGFAVPPVEIDTAHQVASSWSLTINQWRQRLNTAIRAEMSEPTGSIAAAFITGETRPIPEDVLDAMRIAGLYHLLAVSGMNLSVVAGLAFFTLRLLFASIPALALRFPIKKWAAAGALFASYAYLLIAGSPLSAERAFLMVGLIFLAILLDRQVQPMRSVALAALFILLLTPEAVLNAGFQLSFAATAALVAWYEGGHRQWMHGKYGLSKWLIYLPLSLCSASFIAWLSTEPFIIYHFRQFSTYSVLANTLAEPLVSLVLMPLVVIGVLLMPLGLGFLAFIPLEYALNILLFSTQWLAALPYAQLRPPPPSGIGFLCIAFGIFLLCILKTRLRYAGLLLCVTGMVSMLWYDPPHLIISADAKRVAIRLENGDMHMLRGRKDSFAAQAWLSHGLAANYMEKEALSARCDGSGCTLTLHNHSIAYASTMDALAEDCRTARIVITPLAYSKAMCEAQILLDKQTLQHMGGGALWLSGKEPVIQASIPNASRPWSRAALEEMEE